MKKPFVFHPFLFAIFPILFLFAHNIEQMFPEQIIAPLVIVIVCTIIFFSLLCFLFKDKEKAGLIVSFFILLFFSYGHFHNLIRGFRLVAKGITIGPHTVLLLSCGVIFLIGVYFIIRIRDGLRNVTNFLNIAAFLLVLISLINIGAYVFRTRGIGDYIKSRGGKASWRKDTEKPEKLRDIYYLIFDGYASSSALKEFYNYDNNAFIDYLKGKGFYVASRSVCNYPWTFLSLSSSLNMEYVNYLSGILGDSKDTKVPAQMIKNSKVMNFLRSKGYKFIHLGSGIAPLDKNKYADLDIQCGGLNEFETLLIQSTMLAAFKGYFIKGFGREKFLCVFSKLGEIHRIKGPKFVLAHILPPHPPYFFDADGGPVPEEEVSLYCYIEWKQKPLYIDQLEFVNKKIEILVDKILSKTEIPPVIIIQADHGSRSTFGDPGSPGFDGWDNPTKEMLREGMRIFNAYYLPPEGNDLLYDTITPVNTFRVIFNYYFRTNDKLLKDESYFAPQEHPYQFVNITNIVKYD